MEIIIYLVFEENGYTPKNGVLNRPFFSFSSLGNCSGSLKLIGALACKLQNEPKNGPLSAILMEEIKIIGPPLFANFSIFRLYFPIITQLFPNLAYSTSSCSLRKNMRYIKI